MAFNFPFKKSSTDLSASQDKPINANEFLQAINLFKTQREKVGISLEELARETKISRNVLVAIENGWKKYIPEKTYLISMLKTLETQLFLERGSLNGLLAEQISDNKISRLKFNFINIDFLNNWIGSLLYFVFMLLSILALNSQQKYLLKINSISTEPIRTEKNDIKSQNIIINKN